MASVIPSLHNGPTDVLTDTQKKLWSIIAFIFNNPGSISNVIENELVSFRKLDAEFGLHRDQLAAELQQGLDSVIQRTFEGEGFQTLVTVEELDEIRYTLTINISQGTSVVLSSPVPIENGKTTITNWNNVL